MYLSDEQRRDRRCSGGRMPELFMTAPLGPGHEQVDRCSPPRRPIGKARSRTQTSILDGCDVRTRDRNAASRDGSAARAIELFMTGP